MWCPRLSCMRECYFVTSNFEYFSEKEKENKFESHFCGKNFFLEKLISA